MFNLLDLVTPPSSGGSGILAAIAAALVATAAFVKGLFGKKKK